MTSSSSAAWASTVRARSRAYAGQRIPLSPPVGAVFIAWGDAEGRGWRRQATGAEDGGSPRRGPQSGFGGFLRTGPLPGPSGLLDADASYNVVMVTAPVFGPTGTAVVALTLLGLPLALTADHITFYGQKIRDAGLLATRLKRRPYAGLARCRVRCLHYAQCSRR